MPATVPAHPAAVLPLKLLSPRRFDGVALAVGAAAPDLGYAVEGLGIEVRSHAWHSLAWFSLPLTLVIAALIRRAAPVVAAHLPPGGPLAIRDYGVLGTVRHPLRVTVWSALLGAASHLVWDTFTHPYVLVLDPFLGPDTAGLPWWPAIRLISEVVGAVVSLAVAVNIGRHRLLVAWHGPAPLVARRFGLFWSITGGSFVILVAGALRLPGNALDRPNVLGIRLIVASAGAVLCGAAAVRSAGGSPARSGTR